MEVGLSGVTGPNVTSRVEEVASTDTAPVRLAHAVVQLCEKGTVMKILAEVSRFSEYYVFVITEENIVLYR